MGIQPVFTYSIARLSPISGLGPLLKNFGFWFCWGFFLLLLIEAKYMQCEADHPKVQIWQHSAHEGCCVAAA